MGAFNLSVLRQRLLIFQTFKQNHVFLKQDQDGRISVIWYINGNVPENLYDALNSEGNKALKRRPFNLTDLLLDHLTSILS